MGLPGDLLTRRTEGDGAEAEQGVQTKPDRQKKQKTWIAQRGAERPGRQMTKTSRITEKYGPPGTLKDKTHCSRHGAGNSGRGPDHRFEGAEMADKVRHGADRCCGQHKQNVAPAAKTPGERAGKRDEPRQIDPEMGQVGMNEGVGEKSPQIAGKAARQRLAKCNMAAIARRNEAEGVNEDEHTDRRHDRCRNIEYWF